MFDTTSPFSFTNVVRKLRRISDKLRISDKWKSDKLRRISDTGYFEQLWYLDLSRIYTRITIFDIQSLHEICCDCHDERQRLSAGYAWHSRPRTTSLSSNLTNGGDESGWAPLISIPEGLGAPWWANSRESSSRWVSAPRDDPPGVC